MKKSELRQLIKEEIKLLVESTRANVGIIGKDGKIYTTYVHNDGYPNGVGKTLKKYYNDPNKIKSLLKTDDKHGISVLGPKIDGGKGHSFNTPLKGQTVFYGRDRGEKNNVSRNGNIKNLDRFIDSLQSDVNYLYLYDMNDRKWKYVELGNGDTLTDY